jgi:hypothetical protein
VLNKIKGTLGFVDAIDLLNEFLKKARLRSEGDRGSDNKIRLAFNRLAKLEMIFEFKVFILN